MSSGSILCIMIFTKVIGGYDIWHYHRLIYITKNLAVRFRGYDEDEVNEFLEQILKDYENVLEEKKDLESSLKQSTEQVTHFNTIERHYKSQFL